MTVEAGVTLLLLAPAADTDSEESLIFFLTERAESVTEVTEEPAAAVPSRVTVEVAAAEIFVVSLCTLQRTRERTKTGMIIRIQAR